MTKEWWTNAEGVTDGSGVFALRGFRGDYEIKAIQGTKSQIQQARVSGQLANVRAKME